MNTPARIILWLLAAAGAVAAIWIVAVRPSGPTLQQDAEKERAEQRGQNAEICRRTRELVRERGPDRSWDETEREQNEAVVRVKCAPSGL